MLQLLWLRLLLKAGLFVCSDLLALLLLLGSNLCNLTGTGTCPWFSWGCPYLLWRELSLRLQLLLSMCKGFDLENGPSLFLLCGSKNRQLLYHSRILQCQLVCSVFCSQKEDFKWYLLLSSFLNGLSWLWSKYRHRCRSRRWSKVYFTKQHVLKTAKRCLITWFCHHKVKVKHLHRQTLLRFYQESIEVILSHNQFLNLLQTRLMIQTICSFR